MAKTLNTRIKNRFDSLTNWSQAGVELLQGEIALVKVETQQIDQATGDVVTVPAFLMKVGENDSAGNPKAFSALPWMSALAADVYDWAKEEDPSGMTVKYQAGDTWVSSTLADILKATETNAAAIAEFKTGLSVKSDPEAKEGVVQGITYNSATGEFTVSYGTVAEGDIADSAVTEGKIKEGAVTTAKIVDRAVTDDKIATVSASKIIYMAGADDASTITIPEKIEEVEGKIANINTAISGGVHFVGTTTTKIEDGSTTTPVISGKADYAPSLGDVVLYDNKEFIWTGSAWEELGDLGRVATLETWRNKLVKDDTAVVHQFVTEVDIATDGTVTINRAQPTSEDVIHAGSTVKAALEDLAANKADRVHSHADYVNQNAFSNIKVGEATVAADSITDTVEFVGNNITITPDTTNDKITFEVAKANADGKTGIVTLEDSIVNQSITAATSKAVYTVNEKAEDAQGRASAIEANYVRASTDNKLVHYASGTETEIILDCGGAL